MQTLYNLPLLPQHELKNNFLEGLHVVPKNQTVEPWHTLADTH